MVLQELYNQRTLGTFIVNPPDNQILIGGIAEYMNDFMRSKMETQIDNLLMTIEINENNPNQILKAYKIIPNKYFKRCFANMIQIPVTVDYIPEENRHVYKDLLFYSLNKENYENLEQIVLEQMTNILEGKVESEELEGEYEVTLKDDKKIKLDKQIIQKLNNLLQRKHRIEKNDLANIKNKIELKNEIFTEILECFENQFEISKLWMLEN